MTKLEEAITRRVKAARERAGVERKEVARLLDLDDNSYGHYERGRTAFSVEQLFQIARLLRVPVEELLGLPLPGDMSEDERRLLCYYHRLDVVAREDLLEMAQMFLKRRAPSVPGEKDLP